MVNAQIFARPHQRGSKGSRSHGPGGRAMNECGIQGKTAEIEGTAKNCTTCRSLAQAANACFHLGENDCFLHPSKANNLWTLCKYLSYSYILHSQGALLTSTSSHSQCKEKSVLARQLQVIAMPVQQMGGSTNQPMGP